MPFRQYTTRMATHARPAARSCLLVAPPPAADLALARAGLSPRLAGGEREAIAAIEGPARHAAIFVSHALGAPAVAALVAAAGQRADELPVVVLGASGTVQEAVDAMQLGAD